MFLVVGTNYCVGRFNTFHANGTQYTVTGASGEISFHWDPWTFQVMSPSPLFIERNTLYETSKQSDLGMSGKERNANWVHQ